MTLAWTSFHTFLAVAAFLTVQTIIAVTLIVLITKRTVLSAEERATDLVVKSQDALRQDVGSALGHVRDVHGVLLALESVQEMILLLKRFATEHGGISTEARIVVYDMILNQIEIAETNRRRLLRGASDGIRNLWVIEEEDTDPSKKDSV